MLIDIFRGITIVVKFIVHDFWIGAINLLFKKQNPKIKQAYQTRVKANKKRL